MEELIKRIKNDIELYTFFINSSKHDLENEEMELIRGYHKGQIQAYERVIEHLKHMLKQVGIDYD